MQKRLIQAVLLATLATASSLVLAQPANDARATTVPVDARDHDRGFDDWGLLGLLGLLGLVPRKRRDVVVDSTRTPNPIR
jgi:hypothetical protein